MPITAVDRLQGGRETDTLGSHFDAARNKSVLPSVETMIISVGHN